MLNSHDAYMWHLAFSVNGRVVFFFGIFYMEVLLLPGKPRLLKSLNYVLQNWPEYSLPLSAATQSSSFISWFLKWFLIKLLNTFWPQTRLPEHSPSCNYSCQTWFMSLRRRPEGNKTSSNKVYLANNTVDTYVVILRKGLTCFGRHIYIQGSLHII